MKKILQFLILLLVYNLSFSQCLSGDCKNGQGKFDYGYATYTGSFINSKPNGQGTMDYGGGDKFEGNFKDGKEDGRGILYKKNIPKNVSYQNGQIKIFQEPVAAGSNAPKVEGCISGDCYNGYGELQFFASGNVYKGNFKNGTLEGSGKFYFKSGNVLSAYYKNGKPTTGEMTFTTGEVFEGSFNADGSPRTGVYKMSTQGDTVEIADNQITKVRSIAAEKRLAESNAVAEHAKNFKTCSKCNGTGGETVRDSWKGNIISRGNVYDEVELHYGPPHFSTCYYCNGTGEVKR